MKSIWKKFGMGMIATALLFSATACGDKNDTASGNKRSNELTVYTQAATYEGTVNGYVGKHFKDKLGVELKVVPNSVGGTSRFETRLTTGNLGDIVIFTSEDDFEKAVKAGVIKDLSGDLDKMPNVARFTDAIDKMKKKNEDKVYGIPCEVALDKEVTPNDPVQVPSLRYDYYTELGSPEIKDYWDYATVIEQMVEKHPTTESGDKFYGLSMFSEWDGKNVNQIRSIARALGYNTLTDFLNVSATDETMEDILAEDSTYMQGLKWANAFNQKGLLDPDSASQTWEDFLKKAEKGQSAMWIFGYMGDLNFNPVNKELTAEGKGYKRIPNNSMQAVDQMTSTYGNNWYYAISSKAENQEKAMSFIDYMYSDEGAFTFENGPQGVLWDLDENQKPHLTEVAQGSWEAKVPEDQGGGVVSDTYKKLVNGPTMASGATNPQYNSPATYNTWESYLKDNASTLDKAWTEEFDGALNIKEYLVKNDMIASYPAVDLAPMKYSDEQQVVANQVGDTIKEMSWQMIYAKDDATFENLKADLIKKANSLGYAACVKAEKEYAQEYFAARKAAAE